MNLDVLRSKYGLTESELRITQSIMDGEYTTLELEEKFGLSRSTVKHHVTSINRKMGRIGAPKTSLVIMIANAVIDDMEDQADLSIVERRKNEPVDLVEVEDLR